MVKILITGDGTSNFAEIFGDGDNKLPEDIGNFLEQLPENVDLNDLQRVLLDQTDKRFLKNRLRNMLTEMKPKKNNEQRKKVSRGSAKKGTVYEQSIEKNSKNHSHLLLFFQVDPSHRPSGGLARNETEEQANVRKGEPV